MLKVVVLAQQSVDFFQAIRDAVWELYLWLLETVRSGRIVWAFVVVAAIIVYQRFFKK